MPFDDTVARLPVPTVLGGTTRTKKMVVVCSRVSISPPVLGKCLRSRAYGLRYRPTWHGWLSIKVFEGQIALLLA